MKRVFAVLLLVALTACDHVRPVAPPTPPGSISSQSMQSPSEVPVAGSPRALIGDQAVADLRRWYDDTRSDCGGATSPAFLCSGVMLRATANSANYLPWNPNPNSTGVSFSWIRKDTNFSKLAYGYGNGFIFYPKSENAAGSQVIDVECAFPHDGGTNDRPSLSGCGPATGYPQSSRPCDDQGIQTSATWLQAFNGLANKHQGQCGWSMKSSARSNRFTQFILARQGMNAANWNNQNELRMVKWTENSVVPIRAFFYTPGVANALKYAQADQRRYEETFKEFVPIIRLTLPASKSGLASFTYDASDQQQVGQCRAAIEKAAARVKPEPLPAPHKGTYEDPRGWSESTTPDRIHLGAQGYFVARFSGSAASGNRYWPPAGQSNGSWSWAGSHAGTFDDPKGWSEVTVPGRIHLGDRGYFIARFSGSAASGARYWPPAGQSDSSWTWGGAHEGTFDDPKGWSEYSAVGRIHLGSPGYFAARFDGVAGGGWYWPKRGQSDAHWQWLGDRCP